MVIRVFNVLKYSTKRTKKKGLKTLKTQFNFCIILQKESSISPCAPFVVAQQSRVRPQHGRGGRRRLRRGRVRVRPATGRALRARSARAAPARPGAGATPRTQGPERSDSRPARGFVRLPANRPASFPARSASRSRRRANRRRSCCRRCGAARRTTAAGPTTTT